MSDLDDRLAALDPVAGQPYRHPDLDGIISRITSQRVTATNHVWRRFQLKMAGALTATALVTVAAIAALQGAGTVLPLLAIQSAGSRAAGLHSPNPTFGVMEIHVQYHFSVSPDLTSTPSAGLSYQVKTPNDVAAEALRVAAIFGVTNSPITVSSSSNSATVTDAAGRSLDYQSTGMPEWYYSSNSPTTAPATTSNSASAATPSHATLEGDARNYLAKLDYGYTVSSPIFSTASVSTSNTAGSTPGSTNTETVTYVVDVEGIATDQSVIFTIDTNNNVLYASGPAFSVASTSNYPLQSPSDGVVALNAVQQKGVASPSASPTGAPIVDVNLTSATLSLATFQLTDGTTWLLPVYDYAGNAANTDGTRTPGDWYELAVDPSYVKVGSDTSGVGPHGPLEY